MSKNKKNGGKIFNRIMTILAVILLIFLFVKYGYSPAKDMIITNSTLKIDLSELNNTKVSEVIPDKTISLCIFGDVMCHDTNYKDAYQSDGSYDFSHMFANIADHLRSADLTIGNLETTFAGSDRGYSGYPTFNTPDALAYNLRDVGVDVLGTANNHSLDKGFSGITRTLEILDDAGIKHMGTYASSEDRDSILVVDVKGVKIAFLAYTYGTNGIPVPSRKRLLC